MLSLYKTFSSLITIFILNSFLIYSNYTYAYDHCKNYKYIENQHYSKSSKKIALIFDRLANKKGIAEFADTTLSKLISAKSPIIINWIARRKLNPIKDTVKITLQWRKYYLNNFIIGRYPTNTPEINKIVEQLFDEISRISFPEIIKKRFELIFKDVKILAIKRINKFNIDNNSKEQLLSRIKQVNLYWMPQLKNSKFSKMPNEFIKWGIAYDPIPNEINIGIKANAYNNDATIFAVFAHELGHSFDPCRWQAFFNGENPFNSVLKCLRGSKSAHALKRDDSAMNQLIKEGKLSPTFVKSLKLNPTCNKINYPPIGVQKDQLPESFADWFSSEVVSISSYITSDLRKDLCQNQKLMKGSSYISNKNRLDRIYFAHSIIKNKLDIQNENIVHCQK